MATVSPRTFDVFVSTPTISPKAKMAKGNAFRVTLPVDYATSGKRYPVLYFLHGATCNYTTATAMIGIENRPVLSDVIVVVPVRVKAFERGDGRVQVDVSDDGHGIPERNRPHVSRPFFTTRPTGIGLGLAIVRRIAEVHGGALAYEGTPGGGATFSIDVASARSATRRPSPKST